MKRNGGRDERFMITVPVWLIAVLVVAVAILALLLWSAQRGRKPELRIGPLGELPEALASIVGATHGTLVGGNDIQVLQNGDGFFPVLLADIAAAQQTISFETFVWGDGELPRRVAQALTERARAGVEVRLLVDAIGGHKMEKDLRTMMRDAGCQVIQFRPIGPSRLAWINSRTHRKIVVIDGTIGYTFGQGVSWEWEGDAHDAKHWRDTGVRVEGPIVAALQAAFSENWLETTGEPLAGAHFFPPLEPRGESEAHLAYHFQHGNVSSVALLYRLAFAAANRELIIQNPYMVPDKDVIAALADTARRGVDVRIMVPGDVTDAKLVRHASRRLYGRLLEGGVRLYEYRKTLCHQKIIVVDGIWSHVGSTNFDNRSFESMDEVSLGIVDERVAAELKAAFEEDLRDAVEITLDEWRARPLLVRLADLGAYQLNEFL